VTQASHARILYKTSPNTGKRKSKLGKKAITGKGLSSKKNIALLEV
jgi:hypothetical protein